MSCDHISEMPGLGEFCDYCFKHVKTGWQTNAAANFLIDQRRTLIRLSAVMLQGTPVELLNTLKFQVTLHAKKAITDTQRYPLILWLTVVNQGCSSLNWRSLKITPYSPFALKLNTFAETFCWLVSNCARQMLFLRLLSKMSTKYNS